MRPRLSTLLFPLALLTATAATAQTTPPLGWNSWDAYGLTITESQFRDNVTVLHKKLQHAGYRYAVIDEGWFFFNPEARPTPDQLVYAIDANGRYVPVPARFPSNTPAPEPQRITGTSIPPTSVLLDTTFKPLADFVHAQGLLFGIHIVRGIPRVSVERNLPIASSTFRAQDAADTTDACPWDPTNWGIQDTPAGQAWYDSLLTQYASWGIDLLKVDCISDHPYKPGEIRMIRRAIDKAVARTGRPIVLSLSPGPTAPSHAAEVASLATMWRISDDFWDTWNSTPPGKTFPQPLKGQFDRLQQWSTLTLPPGHWPDADMLPFGELRPSPGWGQPRSTRLTPDEQRTVLTLWALNRSPLILGANLTLLDEPTLKLITNRDVLRIDQTATATTQLLHKDDLVLWRATLPKNRFAYGLFNLGDQPIPAFDALSALLPFDTTGKKLPLTDVWTRSHLHKSSQIPPHGSVLLFTK